YKQNSPPYFCLASVFGIAMANGMRAIFLVKDEAQIAYQERYAEGFRNVNVHPSLISDQRPIGTRGSGLVF
ncbi:MAG TPA: hypothetical protein VGR92_10975, partial [Steroidobacteraceae bacterium]|nr:hypothetical protein [Steroidobacteraceae bacterium]